ncbi:OB-fold nucleic acid binding domain-containing protein [Paenibacillus sp. UNC496MF]|uniref:OB-fold nucleic acid binding domain-containing protein n=1 Tax=Paenibacillus sp. UNC496MF TaxID=1502753 RepID=UPI0008E5531E|nr:OB-fold nucleic acid binding domain-containing protein [Paenibacillus sp. UNC496MF]SFJ63490.1 OB-fold nucleic acid binding domain-containing protein [Paenibacillus sp. UNC496MF]
MPTVTQLRPHVTHFSEEIKLKAQVSQEVTVAGRIDSVSQIDDSTIVIMLDDYIGQLRVVMSSIMYSHFKSIIDVGNFVSVVGYVNVVSHKVAGELKSEYSIIGFDMNILSF